MDTSLKQGILTVKRIRPGAVPMSDHLAETPGFDDDWLDAAFQACLRNQHEGSDALNQVERRVVLLHLADGISEASQTASWLSCNHPGSLMAILEAVEAIGCGKMAELFRAVYGLIAPPEEFEDPCDGPAGVENWGRRVAAAADEFNEPKGEKPLPPPLRGQISVSSHSGGSGDDTIAGYVAEMGYTPDSWAMFLRIAESGDEPEFYENWYRRFRHVQGYGYFLNFLAENGARYSLPNPWNASLATATAYHRIKKEFNDCVTRWFAEHRDEARVFDPSAKRAEKLLRDLFPGSGS